jgi:integrase
VRRGGGIKHQFNAAAPSNRPLKSQIDRPQTQCNSQFCEISSRTRDFIHLRGDESIKIPKTLPKPITHEHILHALEHADAMSALAIKLLYTMGLRISELTHLKMS